MMYDIIDSMRQRPAARPVQERYTRGPRPSFDPAVLDRNRGPIVPGEFRGWIDEARDARDARDPHQHKIDLIFERVIRDTGVSRADLTGSSRMGAITRARAELIYELAGQTRLYLDAIGGLVGGRNHCTLVKAIERHCRRNQLEWPRERKGGAS